MRSERRVALIPSDARDLLGNGSSDVEKILASLGMRVTAVARLGKSLSPDPHYHPRIALSPYRPIALSPVIPLSHLVSNTPPMIRIAPTACDGRACSPSMAQAATAATSCVTHM